MTPAETSLLAAISAHLSPSQDQRGDAYHYACVDVQVAIAALQARHWDPAAVAEFTALLRGSTSWGAPAFTPACQSCGATTDLDPVHRPAETGIAARVEHYCHNHTECGKRRHDHTAAISGIAS